MRIPKCSSKIQFSLFSATIQIQFGKKCRNTGSEYKLNFIFRTEWKSELDRERKWRIKVTQIPCDCRDREDPDMKLAPAGTS